MKNYRARQRKPCESYQTNACLFMRGHTCTRSAQKQKNTLRSVRERKFVIKHSGAQVSTSLRDPTLKSKENRRQGGIRGGWQKRGSINIDSPETPFPGRRRKFSVFLAPLRAEVLLKKGEYLTPSECQARVVRKSSLIHVGSQHARPQPREVHRKESLAAT